MPPLSPAHLNHPRLWKNLDYCYPVISRRCKGLSLGINLSQDKKCNFDCVYCEVDRISPPKRRNIDLHQLEDEMKYLIELAISGEIFNMHPFSASKRKQQRFNDLCFSGDAEPTTAKEFPDTVDLLIKLMSRYALKDVKLILITNGTMLQHSKVIEAIDNLMSNNGEIWAKLDSGTDEHYHAINRSGVSLNQIVSNIEFAGKRWPLTIQTMMLEWEGHSPTDDELASYVNRIKQLLKNGVQLKNIQLYTIARPTPEPGALPLPATNLDNIAKFVVNELMDIPVEVFYGPNI
jgi:wyosine [tRNA(Phe)-imidazoG37] synthetase (radical SAM superfamily)